jgi:hypothetical protein
LCHLIILNNTEVFLKQIIIEIQTPVALIIVVITKHATVICNKKHRQTFLFSLIFIRSEGVVHMAYEILSGHKNTKIDGQRNLVEPSLPLPPAKTPLPPPHHQMKINIL